MIRVIHIEGETNDGFTQRGRELKYDYDVARFVSTFPLSPSEYVVLRNTEISNSVTQQNGLNVFVHIWGSSRSSYMERQTSMTLK